MAGWKTKLTKATKQIGTYKPSFDTTIALLADLLEKRDAAQKEFEESGDPMIVELTNKSLATHPALKLAMDCDKAALPYLNDMGLTAAGYKKIKGENKEAPKECKLEDLKSRFKVG